MPRLILFSGGVESTGLASISDPGDILLSIDNPYQSFMTIYNVPRSQKIASLLERELIQFRFGQKIQHVIPFVHQLNHFISVAHLFVTGRNDITEVWLGRNLEETESQTAERADLFHRMISAWNIMNPKIPFNIPLNHLRKKEYWNLIPDHIKPWVYFCYSTGSDVAAQGQLHYNGLHIPGCGQCPKCHEFRNQVMLA